MEKALTSLIQSIYPLPDELLAEVLARFEFVEYPKSYFLVKAGRFCSHLWLLHQGAARIFYTEEDGREVNVWFSFEQEAITLNAAFLPAEPAIESIQLLEDSALFAIDYAQIRRFIKEHHAFALWYIHLFEQQYMLKAEERLGDLQFLPAKARYEQLLGRYPDITNRVSLGHIASFLNITPETLSRIRAGKA